MNVGYADLHALGFDVPPEDLFPTPEARFAGLRRLGERAEAMIGERQAVVLLKRLMGGVLHGMAGAAELRRRAGMSTKLREILSVFSSVLSE